MSCESCRRELLPRIEEMKRRAFEAGKKNERARIVRILRRKSAVGLLDIIGLTNESV